MASNLLEPGTGRIVGEGGWSVEHTPAAATQATISQAAAGTGVRNVCRSITATIAVQATVQTPIRVVLRDGATGAGTVLWSAKLAAPANGVGVVSATGHWVGSENTAMTLEFTAAGVASSEAAVAMSGITARQ